jgi:hypothetical protein
MTVDLRKAMAEVRKELNSKCAQAFSDAQSKMRALILDHMGNKCSECGDRESKLRIVPCNAKSWEEVEGYKNSSHRRRYWFYIQQIEQDNLRLLCNSCWANVTHD